MPMETRPARTLPARMEDRLIVALDLPNVAAARASRSAARRRRQLLQARAVADFRARFRGLSRRPVAAGKNVFLDAKMFDIGETVRRGVERVAERGVSFVTIHGDADIIRAAVEGRGMPS